MAKNRAAGAATRIKTPGCCSTAWRMRASASRVPITTAQPISLRFLRCLPIGLVPLSFGPFAVSRGDRRWRGQRQRCFAGRKRRGRDRIGRARGRYLCSERRGRGLLTRFHLDPSPPEHAGISELLPRCLRVQALLEILPLKKPAAGIIAPSRGGRAVDVAGGYLTVRSVEGRGPRD